jgi:hypothetical protein
MGYETRDEQVRRNPDGTYSIVGVRVVSSSKRAELPSPSAWCYFCDEGPATTSFPLDGEKLVGLGGRGFALGGPLATCERCTTWFLQGADDDLVEFQRLRESARWAAGNATMSASDEDWFVREAAADLQAFHDAVGLPVQIK